MLNFQDQIQRHRRKKKIVYSKYVEGRRRYYLWNRVTRAKNLKPSLMKFLWAEGNKRTILNSSDLLFYQITVIQCNIHIILFVCINPAVNLSSSNCGAKKVTQIWISKQET